MELGHGARPTLSICMTGRDDDYMLDFRYRIETTLNFYGQALQRLNRESEAEILVTDWGSETPLHKTLELNEPARRITKFVNVPQEIIRKTQGGQDFFHVARACNVGLRRARGKHVFVTNTDQLVPPASLESLLRVLKGEIRVPFDIWTAILFVPRVQVPWQFVQRRPNLAEWEQFIFVNEYALLHQPHPPESNWFGSTSGFVFSDVTNTELRGLDETQTGWGWGDIEFGFRAIQNRLFLHLSNLGINAFHMGHPPSGVRHTITPSNNLSWDTTTRRNPDDWGLGEYSLEPVRAFQSQEKIQKVGKTVEAPDAPIVEEIRSRKNTSHIREILSVLSGPGWSLPSDYLALLHFVSWYSLFRLPRSYLEIGTGGKESAGVVASACPSVQMCTARQMSGDIPGTQLTGLLHSLTDLGHHGYFHLLNCPPELVLDKLARLGPLFRTFDLVLANLEAPGLERTGIITSLMGRIQPGGAVVVRCSTKPDFDDMWSDLAERIVDSGFCMYRADGEAVGMLLDRQGMREDEGNLRSRDVLITFDPLGSIAPLEAPQRRETLIRMGLKGIWKWMKSLRDRLKDMK